MKKIKLYLSRLYYYKIKYTTFNLLKNINVNLLKNRNYFELRF